MWIQSPITLFALTLLLSPAAARGHRRRQATTALDPSAFPPFTNAPKISVPGATNAPVASTNPPIASDIVSSNSTSTRAGNPTAVPAPTTTGGGAAGEFPPFTDAPVISVPGNTIPVVSRTSTRNSTLPTPPPAAGPGNSTTPSSSAAQPTPTSPPGGGNQPVDPNFPFPPFTGAPVISVPGMTVPVAAPTPTNPATPAVPGTGRQGGGQRGGQGGGNGSGGATGRLARLMEMLSKAGVGNVHGARVVKVYKGTYVG